MTFLYQLMTTPVKCWVTNLENKIRRSLDKPEIKGFIGHYFLRRFYGNEQSEVKGFKSTTITIQQ